MLDVSQQFTVCVWHQTLWNLSKVLLLLLLRGNILLLLLNNIVGWSGRYCKVLMRLCWSLQASKLFFSLRNVSFLVIFIDKGWNMGRKSLSDPILFDVQQFSEIYRVVNPLGLNVLLRLLLDKILSVSNDVSYSWTIFTEGDSATICQNNVFKWVSGNFCA